MDESIIFPSVNWYKSSGLAVTSDNWLVYGGPSKSLCALEPLPSNPEDQAVDQRDQRYQAHVLNRAHPEKIVCVDICPDWPSRRAVLAGCSNGSAKQWNLDLQSPLKFKSTHSHEIHINGKEEVAGVGYCNNGYAVTVGSFGVLVKWDLTSNVAKPFSNVLKGFKPTCLSCSPHIHLTVAVGTRQGVVFVVDLTGAARVVFKVRGQDDEIVSLSWCPQYEVAVRKALQDGPQKKSFVTQKMEKIRLESEAPEVLAELDERVKQSASVEHYMKTNEKFPKDISEPTGETAAAVSSEETARLDNTAETDFLEQDKSKKVMLDKSGISKTLPEDSFDTASVEHYMKTNEKFPKDISEPTGETAAAVSSEETARLDNTAETDLLEQDKSRKVMLDKSGISKTLPEDSFDTSIVQEDDMFDIYKDFEADEFGHTKYKPEDILVKVPEEERKDDYLAECFKLKEEILKRKNAPEFAIEALVDALDKTHVDALGKTHVDALDKTHVDALDKTHVDAEREAAASPVNASDNSNGDAEGRGVCSVHIQRHLLATVGKHGSIRVWSKLGRLLGSAATQGQRNNQRQQRSTPSWTSLLWYKANSLLIADGKSQLLECNPLNINSRSKIEWRIVHTLHRRGLYAIATNAPRVQSADLSPDASADWSVWTTALDRNLIRYSMEKNCVISVHNTCGGFLYNVVQCPYDARKVAVSAGDGAVRVWEMETGGDDDSILRPGHVTTFWQNVQGKVLTAAWHPSKENLLAFGTAECRVGLIDTSGKQERAKVLAQSLTGGVYSLYWGAGDELYACAAGQAVVYQADKPDAAPTPLAVELEGQQWELSTVRWYPHALVCGNDAGAVAVLTLDRPHKLLAAAFVFSKMIHTIDWHPLETSNSTEESRYKNLIAVCSLDKLNTVVILEYGDNEDGSKRLSTWKTLAGHTGYVGQVAWNPHIEEQLLSTAQDCTVRIWDVTEGVCISIFADHPGCALGAAWSAFPQQARVLSGGGDCCLRLWRVDSHPAEEYDFENTISEFKKDRRKSRRDRKKPRDEQAQGPEAADVALPPESTAAAVFDATFRSSKRFLLSLIHKQMNPCKVNGIKKILKKHLKSLGEGMEDAIGDPTDDFDTDYLNIFGTVNELNDVLDVELERHEDTGHFEAWVILNIFRGRIDALVQSAARRNMLDPFILGIAPSVSLKYWKDVTQMYLAQIDRLVAKGDENKLCVQRDYGGPPYRKAAALLSLHDVKGAVAVLTEAKLFKEAYVLCRTRHVESIAKETLEKWAELSNRSGVSTMAAVCYIALGDLVQAAKSLGKSNDEECLSLAADIAKLAGQNTFAGHMEEKRELIATVGVEPKPTEQLKPLLTRAEVLLREEKKAEVQYDLVDAEKLLEELETKMDLLFKESEEIVKDDELQNGVDPVVLKEVAQNSDEPEVANNDGTEKNKTQELKKNEAEEQDKIGG